MLESDYADHFRSLAFRFLGRELESSHGYAAATLDKAAARLGHPLPLALRGFYRAAGRFAPFSSAHNRVLPPPELYIDSDYLIFMDENQSVVTWGFRVVELDQTDPTPWQRNNTPPVAWYSEERSFTALLLSMFEWYAESSVWTAV